MTWVRLAYILSTREAPWLPGFLRQPLLALANARCWTLQCAHGHHPPTADRSACRWCGTALEDLSVRRYRVELRDGSAFEKAAVDLQHAEDLVVYGDWLPGLINVHARHAGRMRVHPSNITRVIRIADGPSAYAPASRGPIQARDPSSGTGS
jgi:hypothetical protein